SLACVARRDRRTRRPGPLPSTRAEPEGAAPGSPRRATTSRGHQTGRAAALGLARKRRLIAAFDVRLDALARLVVVDLARWRFHEVRGRRHDRSAEAAIERELAAADG